MIFRSLGCAFSFLGATVLVASGCSDNGGTNNPQTFGGATTAGTGGAAGGGASGAGTGGSVTPVGGGGVGGAVVMGGSAGQVGGGGLGGGVGGSGGTTPGEYTIPTITWPSAECAQKASDLVGQMSPAEKAAQLVMGQNPDTGTVKSSLLGTVFSGGSFVPPGGATPNGWSSLVDGYIAAGAANRLKIPIFYGIDAVHGASRAIGAVLFPHNAGLGSSRDPQLVEDIGKVTALEAAAMGWNWTYAPTFSVSYDDRWGRVFESYSEDPELVGLLGTAAVLGLQGRGGLGTGTPGIVACGKHFAGDGQATAGTSMKNGVVDRGNVQIDEATMKKLGTGPYERAIKAGIGTIMVSDAQWNGASMTSHKHLITDILKGELAFKGAVATDWEAAGPAGGAVATVNAGVDILMEPTNWQAIQGQIASAIGGAISNERANDAVKRVLAVKCQAGLFDKKRDTTLLAQIGSADHRALGRRAVAESLVLLKNDKSALPLKKGGKFWVVGSGADSLDRQTGGWSVGWQNGGGQTTGTTIKAAIGKVGTVVGTAGEADAAVVVVSEKAYAEFLGDSESIDTITGEDWSLVGQARASGKPVIVIIVSGRPVLIQSHLADGDAWIAAWLPGTEGDGVADLLFGDKKFIGKLSHSWPKTQNQANVNMGQPGYDPLFKLGDGLTF